MSTEYIERGALLKKVVVIPPAGNYGSDQRIVFAGDIESEPAADVEPVVHAHWEWKAPYMVCSACNRHSINRYQSKRCQHCGAHMDERSDA